MELLTLINETCRLCCKRSSEGCNMTSLFEGNDGRTLAAKITKLTGIKIEPQDGLPPVACMKCTREVNRVVHFVEICQVSNKILTHLFQKYCNNLNNLPASNTDEASVSQHLPHASNVIKTLLPVSSASDFRGRTQSRVTVPRTLVSQHNDISHFSKPTNVTAVNNSPNILKSVTSIVSLHESSVSACQVAQIHTPVEDRTHEKDNQNNHFKSSDNTAVNFLPSLYSTIHQSVSSNNNDLHHHKLENRLSSSRNIPGAKENSHSTTVVQHTFETNSSKKVQNKCQAVLAQEPLCSAVVVHAAKALRKMKSSVCPVKSNCKHSETGSVNKLDSTISQILDGTHDCGIDLYNKENTIQQPYSHNLTHVGKPCSNTENYTQISSSENKEHNLIHDQVSIHDAGSRSVYNSECNVMHTKRTLPLPAQNDNVSIATVNLKDQIRCTTAVENAALPSIKVTSSCDITALHNIPQHKSGAPCTHPPPPLVPVTESWKQSLGAHSYVPKTAGAVATVNNRNAPLVSGLDRSYDKECSTTEMRVAVEQHVPNRIPVTSTYTSEENHSLAKHSTPNLHSNFVTTKSVSQGKPSPSIADIPASMSKILLNPSEVSEIVRAIGSEFGVFLENDDTIGNISQAPDYSASGTRVTTEYSNPQLRRNFATPSQTSGPAMLQAQRDPTSSIGKSINIPLSHRDINKQPQASFSLPQQQFTQIMTSTNYICKAPDCVPNDYQSIPSRRVTPVNKHTKHRKRHPEEDYSASPKQRKCGSQSKSCVSKQRTKETKRGYLLEDNLSLTASIYAAFPDRKSLSQEELQSRVINSDQEKQLGLSEIQGLCLLKTSKRSGKELQSTEASGVEKESEQQDPSPEVLAAEINPERLNKLNSFRIKITKTNGKYRSSSPQKYSTFVCQDAQDLSAPENREVQSATCEYRPYIRKSELKPYQLAPFVVVKRLNTFFVPDVTYRLTDVNVINLLDKM